MANRKTYSDEFIHQLLYEKAQGATLKELSSKYNLTDSQVSYCIYVRGQDLQVPAPPIVIKVKEKRNLWQKIKDALKW
jgi:Mor family transcriptional regulator